MNTSDITIRPDHRQFLAEAMPLLVLGLAGMAAFPFIPHNKYVSYAYTRQLGCLPVGFYGLSV